MDENPYQSPASLPERVWGRRPLPPMVKQIIRGAVWGAIICGVSVILGVVGGAFAFWVRQMIEGAGPK